MSVYCGGGVLSGGGGSSSSNAGGLNDGARMMCIGRIGRIGPAVCAACGLDKPGTLPEGVVIIECGLRCDDDGDTAEEAEDSAKEGGCEVELFRELGVGT